MISDCLNVWLRSNRVLWMLEIIEMGEVPIVIQEWLRNCEMGGRTFRKDDH